MKFKNLLAAAAMASLVMSVSGCDGDNPGALAYPGVVGLGYSHSCAIVGQELKCWGEAESDGAAGVLGVPGDEDIGDDDNEMGANLDSVDLGSEGYPVQVSAGYYFTCVLLSTGKVKCFGYNSDGYLGLGDTDNRGDDPGEMGDNLEIVDLGTGYSAVQIATNYEHSCAILDDGSVKCWGVNDDGQLGQDHTDAIGDDEDEMGDNLDPVDLGEEAVYLALGAYHSCALLKSGAVKCWGLNDDGILGQGHEDSIGDDEGEMADLEPINWGSGLEVIQVDATPYTTCVLFTDGRIKCVGDGGYGETGNESDEDIGDEEDETGSGIPFVDVGGKAKALSSGDYARCVLRQDDQVVCFGYYSTGNLGYPAGEDIGDNEGEMGSGLEPVDLGEGNIPIWVFGNTSEDGYYRFCAVFTTGQMKCWGYNTYGMLGLGDTESRGDDEGEMGDDLPFVDLGGEIVLP